MKVLEINICSGCKSTGRIATDIASLLAERGDEVCVAYGRGNIDRGIQTYKICSGAEVAIDAAKSRILDNAGFNNYNSTGRFIEWVERYDPDVIHLHNIHGYYINIQLLFDYIKRANKKTVWTLHDCWAFTGHCAYFDYAGCDKWKTGCGACPQKKAYPASLVADRSAKNYQLKRQLFTGVEDMTTVTPSEWLAELVKQSFLKDYPVKVINNGIDLSVFKPDRGEVREEYALEGKKIVLAVASIWEKRKGLEDVIRLSELLGPEYKTVIIGLTEEQIAAVDSDRILALKRTDSVQKLVNWYSSADVFVNTTYEDNYPTVNLESQACGTPVITYRSGGATETVPGENTVDTGDINAMAEMIKKDLPALKIKKAQDAGELFKEYLKLFDLKR